jgi:hypothetical protein
VTIRALTADEHFQVLVNLTELGKTAGTITSRRFGKDYPFLMGCFLAHNLTCAETLIDLQKLRKCDDFPVAVGYSIVRTMFEIDVNAHFITIDPSKRSQQYVNFRKVLVKNEMESIRKHLGSLQGNWGEACNAMWENSWSRRDKEILEDANLACEWMKSEGLKPSKWKWSGLDVKTMSEQVDHTEAYDILYSKLSSFSHMDVTAATRYAHSDGKGLVINRRSRELEVADVFRYADTFMTCFLELFGKQFGSWSKAKVVKCWDSVSTKHASPGITRKIQKR